MNSHFNTKQYLGTCFDPQTMTMHRKRIRGYSIIESMFFDYFYNYERSEYGAFYELGIGGAGPHIEIRQLLPNNIPIIGVDITDPDNFKTAKEIRKHKILA